MQYLLSLVIGPLLLIIGGWISLLPLRLVLAIYEGLFKPKENKRKIITLYLTRITLTVTVAIIFEILIIFGANKHLLPIVFFVFVIFFAEPQQQTYIFNSICNSDSALYNKTIRKLRLTRIITYLITTILLFPFTQK